jgi:hypothetical protein
VLTRELREAYVTRALEVVERDGKTPAGYVCVWNSLTLRHEIMVKTTDDHYVFLPIEDEDDMTLAMRPPEFVRKNA